MERLDLADPALLQLVNALLVDVGRIHKQAERELLQTQLQLLVCYCG